MSDHKETLIDDESAALLAEMEGPKKPEVEAPKPKKNKAPARSKASANTVTEDKEPASSDGNTLTNTGKNPRRVGGTTIPVGEDYTLTERELEDDALMAKVNHAVTLGVLSRDNNG